jgi:hypothetical protein
MPVLGEYNDRSSKVLARHLEWSRQANVNLWITSWWGADSETDITTSNYILKHRDLRDMKLCLFYETTGRIDVETNNTNRVYNDIAYAAETYFNHPNYHRIDGRPVMFVYLTRVLERRELLKDVLSKMRTAAFKKGHTNNLLIVNSFNEWHEDTQIEPVVQGGATALPWFLTRGRVYRGYGELYLNILRRETTRRSSRKRSSNLNATINL